MIMDFIDKAVESGARLKKAAAIMGINARTIIRWRQQGGGPDQRKGPSTAPANKLNEQERQQVLDISNSASFRDLYPKQIVPKLADQVVYLASESAFYRVLKEHKDANPPAGFKTRCLSSSKAACGHRPLPGVDLGHHVSEDFR